MEDQGRGLDSNQKMIPPVKSGHKERKEFTVMVMRSVGKIRSFKISRRIILITSIFLFLYILTSVYIFNEYFKLRSKYKNLTKKTEFLEENLINYQKELKDRNLYVAGLEDYMQIMIKAPENIDRDKKPDADLIPADRTSQNEKDATTAQNSISGIVEIRDIIFKIENRDLILDFQLANSKSEENTAEGYLHIIAMGINKECPDSWNNSRDKLSNCIPVNYKHGQQFLIQRFRPYRINFKMNSQSELPSFIKILVYDQSGRIMLEKELPVINVSTTENM